MELPLSKTEKLCRSYYLKYRKTGYGKLSMNDPLPDEDYTEAFHRLFLQAIRTYHEDMLIPKWTNIWILSSPRYMPVYLHSHDFIELIYVYNGSCTHTIREQTEALEEGDIYILPPHMPHRIECLADDCIVFHIMVRCSAFNSSFLGLLQTHNALSDFFTRSIYGSGNLSIRFATKDDRPLKQTIRRIFSESQHHTDYTAVMMETLFQLLCLHLAQHHLSNLIVKENGKDHSFVPKILEYISHRYSEVTLQDISRHFGYSEGHLRRIISTATGKSFKEVVTEQKLIHAQIMLKSSDKSVAQIAEKTGFGDVRTMQRLFKNKYGKTPSNFRLEMQ